MILQDFMTLISVFINSLECVKSSLEMIERYRKTQWLAVYVLTNIVVGLILETFAQSWIVGFECKFNKFKNLNYVL